MKLGEFVANEHEVPLENVMFLRHSDRTVKQLQDAGVTLEEYTFMQPINSPYDYRHPDHPPTHLLAVIVHDRVYGVFKVLGVDAEGDTYSLSSAEHQQFDKAREKPPRPARRFQMKQVHSATEGVAVYGWEHRQRTAVQRASGSFFGEISIAVPDLGELNRRLAGKIQDSISDTAAARHRRLESAPVKPSPTLVTTTAFIRNADVIAEVLSRAKGNCELCHQTAPFNRRSDGTPYLEVHHKVRLADGGEDTVENAIALCPNCHRREHYA
ncbi:HNH endonuclease [Marinobacter piscensis]|uniref:HNH endonuclease n=1 Tax=Marinobacter piscensis TaxID=1562308 RepID=UPI001FE68FCC|nr:HNH endonuclease signature motif containing protein [Marinobacter piscensis]